MKILKIEFENINSLRQKHVIDFTKAPFTSSSLFAITGPTGSGKSTILDVISLALFNQVPRLGKITKNEIISKGAILTRNQPKASAKVTYLCKKGTFSSHWSISTNRNGNLRDYEMELGNVETGQLLDLKKSDVPNKNEELIGLSYDQFIKAVLLAQGEFAQFLKVKKDERGALLEKITGTGIYRQLGIKAYEKHKEAVKDIAQQQHEIEIIERQLLDKEVFNELNTTLKKYEAEAAPIQANIQNWKKSLELKKQINRQEREINDNLSKKEQVNLQLNSFTEQNGERLSAHEQLHEIADDLRLWHQLSAENEKLTAELKTSEEKKNATEQLMQQHLQEAHLLIHEEVDEQNLEVKVETFTQQVAELQDLRKSKALEYNNYKQLYKSETKDLQLNYDNDPDNNIEQLNTLKEAAEDSIEEIKSKLSGLEIDELKKKLEATQQAYRQSEKLSLINGEIEKQSINKELLSNEIKALPPQIERLTASTNLLKERIKGLKLEKENQVLRASLDELRNSLQPNTPCPLCGSEEHPFASHLPAKNNELDALLQENEISLQEENDELVGLKTKLNQFESQHDELKAQLSQLQNRYAEEKEAFNKQYEKLAFDDNTDWEEELKEIASQLELKEQFDKENQLLKAIEAGIPLLEQIKTVVREGKEIAEKLKEIYQGEDVHKDSRQLLNKWAELKQQKINIQDQLISLQTKLTENKNALLNNESNLSSIVSNKGFQSIKAAFEALLPNSQYIELKNEHDRINNQLNQLATSIHLLQSQLDENKAKDTEQPEDEIVSKLSELETQLAEINNKGEECRRQLRNHEDNLKRRDNIKLQIADKEAKTKRWKLLNELIGDAQGKRFNEFAQDLTLSQLLVLANNRLKGLSDRYLIDKPDENEDDSLIAIDEHMGGLRRSVKTLSGGETFLLSLSLALALSDLASKDVEINSLFIDEGFGTLDPETLDQTLDTLEKLQAESSKTIGIISHVDSLKERIATQIKLKRNGQGYSTLEVNG